MRVAAYQFLRYKVGWLLLVMFFMSVSTTFSQTTYEAESAVRSEGTHMANGRQYSGGKEVTYIGGESNELVTFDRVVVAQAGLYPLTVFYTVGDDRSFLITVNTNTRFDLIFFNNSAPNGTSRRTILVPLNTGTNRIEFSNDGEYAPDLDCIVVGAAPVESVGISGSITSADGSPLAGVEVLLSSQFESKTVTDDKGRYEFPFLPVGNYYVRPVSPENLFSPYETFCCATNPGAESCSFVTRQMAAGATNVFVMQSGRWRIHYDLASGLADIFSDGRLLIPKAFAVARLPETVTSMDYKSRKVTSQPVNDGFGRGMKYVIESANGDADKMIQTFWLYQNADYFLTEVKVSRKPVVSSNYLSPLTSQTPAVFLPDGDDRVLFVPFDNDKWIRYDARSFGNVVTSYEVSAFYDNTNGRALVVGSIEHDTWKTGVRSTSSSNAVTSLEVFGGVTSSKTRDVLPHGKISGEIIGSPKIFVGSFSDWRDGLEAYAKANAIVAPPRPWNCGVPFGWNSWGKLQDKLTFDKAVQVSDFFAKELPQLKNDGVIYIGLDSGWSQFSETQLKQFVEHCRTNHQEAGIYFTPFAAWHVNDDTPVPGTKYQYKDLFLYAHGVKEAIDGGVALDPTHPGTKMLIKTMIDRFKADGFKYVKADFLTQGALEADHFYDSKVTTGIQAYNEGMKFVDEELGKGIYLNESISPLFPSQYADSRRISCDTFGDIRGCEYLLNSLTFGWWLSDVYDFNDADHVVLGGYSEGENRVRVTSSVITGIFINGDDFSDGGGETGKQRALKFLTNTGINDIARIKKSFRPVEGAEGNQAANLFTFTTSNAVYLAAFNYSDHDQTFDVALSRLGIQAPGQVIAEEVWSGRIYQASSVFSFNVAPADAVLFKFEMNDTLPPKK